MSGNVRLWDAEAGFPSISFQLMGADHTYLEFTADGWLLASRRQGEMLIVNAATGQQILTGRFWKGSLSGDGKWLAASTDHEVAFWELKRPESICEYVGHRAPVQQIVWSADGTHFASIDHAFQVHVWRRDLPTPIRSISAPHEHFFAHRGNAALALSNDGRILAYASGGRETSHLLVYDTSTGVELWKGTLPGAYEHLGTLGDDRFLLVRDDFGRAASQYEWRPGGARKLVKVLRQGEPGEAGTLGAMLTPDGRHFCWIGPAKPENSKRVELWETDSSRVRRFPEPQPDAFVSDDGKSLWLDRGQQTFHFDLGAGDPGRRVDYRPVSASGDSRWLVCKSLGEHFGRRIGVPLHRWGGGQPWLEFFDHLDKVTLVPTFSRDGRYLAWGVDRGAVKVADLHTLQDRIEAFERVVLPK